MNTEDVEFAKKDDEDLAALFLNETSLIDVRAPIEFAAGHAPGAVNLPLLDDEQRAAVGLEYKQRGQGAAVALGHRLLDGSVRKERLNKWREYAEKNPQSRICCFRGGLRSQLVQSSLRQEHGVSLELIAGGYKRLRGFLLETLDRLAELEKFIVVSGFTGAGKTDFLANFHHYCDLEGIARHRGSAFGRVRDPQPSQANFENQLAVSLLKLSTRKVSDPIVIEDESRTIGKCTLPARLFARMQSAPMIVIELPRPERAANLISTYVTNNYLLRDGDKVDEANEEKFLLFANDLNTNLNAIETRLGGAEFKTIKAMVAEAIKEHREQGLFAAHIPWVSRLLEKYYDPVYDRHLQRELKRVVFRGEASEALSKVPLIPIDSH